MYDMTKKLLSAKGSLVYQAEFREQAPKRAVVNFQDSNCYM